MYETKLSFLLPIGVAAIHGTSRPRPRTGLTVVHDMPVVLMIMTIADIPRPITPLHDIDGGIQEMIALQTGKFFPLKFDHSRIKAVDETTLTYFY